jgi:hypothetical protein
LSSSAYLASRVVQPPLGPSERARDIGVVFMLSVSGVSRSGLPQCENASPYLVLRLHPLSLVASDGQWAHTLVVGKLGCRKDSVGVEVRGGG